MGKESGLKISMDIGPEKLLLLPTPLFQLVRLLKNEAQPFRKVHRLIDTFEWAIKWHTLLAVSDLIREQQIPDKLKILLAEGLRTPSLGTWMLFYRECLSGLSKPSFPFKEWSKLEELEKKHGIVAFRNSYAHGATPADADCQADCDKCWPVLRELIDTPLFNEVKLIASGKDGLVLLQGETPKPMSETPGQEQLKSILNKIGQTAALLPKGKTLLLWPIGVYAGDPKESGEMEFFYFNALKDKKVEQLNYEKSLKLRDKSIWEPFHKVLPLGDWRRITSPDLELFREKIDVLTENFKGRIAELKQLTNFCLTGKGTCFVWGVPGVGKSALLAQTFKVVRAGGQSSEVKHAGKPLITLEYFIRRGTEYANTVCFLRYLCQKLDGAYGLKGHGLGDEETELWEQLQARLNAISDNSGSAQAVLLVDGLDEHPELRKYIPESRNWLNVLVSSRPQSEVKDWARERDREHSANLELGPLGENDVRAILYDVVDKYQVGFTKEYVQAVTKRSQGNPLYLKLLCDQLFHAGGKVGSIQDIPAGMTDLYSQTIKRVSREGKEPEVVTMLCLLAEAKASLNLAMIAEFMSLPKIRIMSLVDLARELLMQDPVAQDLEYYQLFHESLREWLRNNFKSECASMGELLANRCFAYKELKDKDVIKYALNHAAEHLNDLGDHNRLWELLRDEHYRELQLSVFKQFTSSFNALRFGLGAYIARDGELPEDDARLCWLALRAGELGHQAKTEIYIAFEWAKNRPLDDLERIPDALKRFEVLNEDAFFRAILLLLWIEANRHSNQTKESRNTRDVILILNAAANKLPIGEGSINWSEFLSISFIVEWIKYILKIFDLQNEPTFIKFIEHTDDFTRRQLIEVSNHNEDSITFRDDSITEKLWMLGINLANNIQDNTHKKESLSVLIQSLPMMVNDTIKVDFHSIINFAIEVIPDEYDRTYLFYKLGSVFARRGNVAEANSCFSRALETASKIDTKWVKVEVLTYIAAKMSQAGDSVRARATIAKAINLAKSISDVFRKNIEFTLISKALLSLKKDKFASYLLCKALADSNEIKNAEAKAILLAAIAASLSFLNNSNESEIVLLKGFEITLNSEDEYESLRYLKDVLSCMNEKSDIKQSRKLYSQIIIMIDGCKSSEAVKMIILTIVDSLSQTDDFDGKAEILAELLNLLKKNEKADEYSDAIILFARIARTLAIDGKSDESRLLLSEAIDRVELINGNSNISHAIGEIATSLDKLRINTEKEELLERLMKISYRIDHNYYKSEALAEIAKAYMKSEEIEMAIQTVDKIESINSDSRFFSKTNSEVTAMLLKKGDQKRAWQKFSDQLIEKKEFGVDRVRNIGVLRIVKSLAKVKKYNLALMISEKICDEWIKAKSFLAIALSKLQIGDQYQLKETLIKALFYSEKIKVQNIANSRTQTFSEIVRVFAQISNNDVKEELFKYAIKIAGINTYEEEQSYCFRSISEAMAEAKMINRSLQIAQDISDEYCRSSALSDVAISFAHSEMIEQSLETVKLIKDERSLETAMRGILSFIEKGENAKAKGMYFDQAIPFAEKMNDGYNKNILYQNIAAAFAQAGFIERSLSLNEKISDESCRSFVFAKIATALIKSNNVEKAIEIGGRITNYTEKVEVQLAIAKKMMLEKDIERAAQFFTQAVCTTEKIVKGEQKYDTFMTIALAMAQEGLFDQAIQITEKIENCRTKVNALVGIAKMLYQLGKIDASRSIVRKSLIITEMISKGLDKIFALKEIIEFVIPIGSPIELRSIFKDISWSETVRLAIIPQWQRQLVESGVSSISLLRSSFLYYPFNEDLSMYGIVSLICSLIESERLKHIKSIINECPKLELNVICEEKDTKRTIDNLNDWIETVKDADDKQIILTLAKKVKNGNMTKAEFEHRINTFCEIDYDLKFN